MLRTRLSALVFSLFTCCFLFSQDDSSSDDLKIFLDCNVCDNTYMRQNLGNVQFVRDQDLSDVHLFFTTQRNGSGGRSYEVDYIGKGEFSEINFRMSFNSDVNMTDDDERKLILEQLKLGLVRFWIAKGRTDVVTVSVPSPENEEEQAEEEDPWNYWLFRLGARGFFDGQETVSSSNINFNFSARRVTEKNKFFFRIGYGENKRVFTFDGEDIENINNNKNLNISDVLSINDHWSYGFFGNIGTSTFSNRDLFWGFKPAIEYDFFKYNESAKKILTLSYRNGIVFNDYIERTVFNETEEYLWEHNVVLGGSINQEWGNLNAEARFDQFLHDTELYSVGFSLGANIRIFKGFNFDIFGRYNITRNQIAISGGGVSLEELLLQQQQLQSGYNYFVSMGFSYSFGSIYNTVVNPRFNR
ncbi:hypothetical protein Q2T40_17880 [Winogradskyella maritima]|uniref:DUF481 domain-containing protein n=1 Tax=Winogradskyella maritima TaxID=1517766 RepID=A0ABV8AEL8_9FLAO|nr:hypothetical protein [Winogradskyella maritima]